MMPGFNEFARQLGLPNSLRPFGLSEMLSYTGIQRWINQCGDIANQSNCARQLRAKYFEVVDASRAYCDQMFQERYSLCVPEGANSELPDFTKSYDLTQLPGKYDYCFHGCANDVWDAVLTANLVRDRGMILVPTTRQLAMQLDRKSLPTARLNGVLGLRLTIEFEGGRTTTVDVP